MTLTNRQRAFVEEYLQCWNASLAARNSGYDGPHPDNTGFRLLRTPAVAEEVKNRLAAKTMTSEEVLMRLAEQARGVHTQFIRPDGSLDMRLLMESGHAHLIKSIKPSRYGDIVEFYDAQTALINIGKHLQLFTERVEHSGSVDVVKGYTTISPDDWDNEPDSTV